MILTIIGQKKESILFFTISGKEAAGYGLPLSLFRDPQKVTGIEKVLQADQFSGYLAGLNNRGQTIYTMFYPEELMRENIREKYNSLQQTPEVISKPGYVFACDIQVIHPDEEIGVPHEDTIIIKEKVIQI